MHTTATQAQTNTLLHITRRTLNDRRMKNAPALRKIQFTNKIARKSSPAGKQKRIIILRTSHITRTNETKNISILTSSDEWQRNVVLKTDVRHEQKVDIRPMHIDALIGYVRAHNTPV
jgi:hypothetical protein